MGGMAVGVLVLGVDGLCEAMDHVHGKVLIFLRLAVNCRREVDLQVLQLYGVRDPLDQHLRNKGFFDEVHRAHLEAADFRLAVIIAGEENHRDVVVGIHVPAQLAQRLEEAMF